MRSHQMSRSMLHCVGARGRYFHGIVLATTVFVLCAGTVSFAGASKGTGAQLRRTTAGSYSGVLAGANLHSFYVLSAEANGALHCTGACLKFWHPLIVRSSIVLVSREAGVSGHVGFVARSLGMKQVTFNGYPLYWFVGDAGAHQTRGQGIAADGGTWHLVHAGATNSARTFEIGPTKSTATSTTTSTAPGPSTTTTAPAVTNTHPPTTTMLATTTTIYTY